MNPDELRSRVAAFPGWHYQFNLDGIPTPIWNEIAITRHEKRGRYFFDTLVRLCGESLKGRRVLDLGCNAGWGSLKAIEAGCDFVAGGPGPPRARYQTHPCRAAQPGGPARTQYPRASTQCRP